MRSVKILQGKTVKVGDTGTEVRLQLLRNGDTFDLSSYDATVKIRDTGDDTVIVDSAATVEQAGRGIVSYQWQSGDTDEAGIYEGEVQVTDGSTTMTFPNDRKFQIQIQQVIN